METVNYSGAPQMSQPSPQTPQTKSPARIGIGIAVEMVFWGVAFAIISALGFLSIAVFFGGDALRAIETNTAGQVILSIAVVIIAFVGGLWISWFAVRRAAARFTIDPQSITKISLTTIACFAVVNIVFDFIAIFLQIRTHPDITVSWGGTLIENGSSLLISLCLIFICLRYFLRARVAGVSRKETLIVTLIILIALGGIVAFAGHNAAQQAENARVQQAAMDQFSQEMNNQIQQNLQSIMQSSSTETNSASDITPTSIKTTP